MTGFPDGFPDDLPDRLSDRFPDDLPGHPGPGRGLDGESDGHDGHNEELERVLRPPAEFLAAPPGAYDRIRRRARRRRNGRALVGGTALAAVITGSVYLVGTNSPHSSGQSVTPPASHTRVDRPPTGPVSPVAPTTPTDSGQPTTEFPVPATPSTDVPVPSTTDTPSPIDSPPYTPSSVPTTSPTVAPQCTAGQLSASLDAGNAGAGNLYRYLVLTNHGTECQISGYPGLSLLDSGGRQIGPSATRVHMGYGLVDLGPGVAASATVHTINHQGTCLPTSSQVRVYPPGSRTPLIIPGQIANCDNLLTVTPFTYGRTGNPPA